MKDDEVYDFDFEVDEVLNQTELENQTKQTQPPTRYNEATFVKELDKQGIGRPSTYATIISVLLDPKRDYCKIDNRYIIPTSRGIKLSGFLDKSFGDIINIKYTAEMEKQLDTIAKGKEDEVSFLTDFYKHLCDSINKVQKEVADYGKCPECGSPLVKRRGPYGFFLGCSSYPKCKYLKSLTHK